jgi:hypothetical protein
MMKPHHEKLETKIHILDKDGKKAEEKKIAIPPPPTTSLTGVNLPPLPKLGGMIP